MNRIDTLTELSKGIDTLLDIGTDHGYLILNTLKKGYVKKGIAADINEGPLLHAKRNIAIENLNDKVVFAKSNGFLNIKDPFDGVCIAGMGVHLITGILSQPHEPAKRYILQTNTKVVQLREYLSNNNFQIINEKVVYEKHYYIIIVAIKGHQLLSKEDLLVGPILKNDPSAVKYYQKEVHKLENIISKVDSNKKNELIEELDFFKKQLKILKKY